jgi:hypothetical protein
VFVPRHAIHFEDNAFGYAILESSEERRLLQKNPFEP